MAFSLKTWLDRVSEYPTRRTLVKEDGTSEIVTVTREEGTISQEGDAFSAENMNDLETRIQTAIEDIETSRPVDHASTTTDYGVGNSTNYGHVKLSTSITSTSGTGSGIAAAPYAVYQVNQRITNIQAFSVTLSASSWSGSSAPYTYTASVSGVSSSYNYEILGFVPSGTLSTDLARKEALGNITYFTSSSSTLTFVAGEDVPTVDLPIYIRRVL